MYVAFQCLTCGTMLGVDMDSAGPSVNCPTCKSVVEVPDPSTGEVFRCVNCSTGLRIVGSVNGTSIECPACHKGVVVPEHMRHPGSQ